MTTLHDRYDTGYQQKKSAKQLKDGLNESNDGTKLIPAFNVSPNVQLSNIAYDKFKLLPRS